jgi:hypothetical protein
VCVKIGDYAKQVELQCLYSPTLRNTGLAKAAGDQRYVDGVCNNPT